jgi:hypothetical protein
MFAALLLTVLMSAPAVQSDAKKDPTPKVEQPAKKVVEVFAGEDFYKKQDGKEEEFVGRLERLNSGGKTIYGRNNPYRVVVVQYREVPVDVVVGKEVVKVKEKRAEATALDMYVAGKAELLVPFVGKQVKITGKWVMVKQEGKTYPEIWPARVELYEPLKLPPAGEDEGCCEAGDDVKEMKIHAKARWQYVSANPDGDKKGRQFAIRSAAELVAATPFKNLDAPQQVVEKKATEELAKALKVDTIDWSKQMLVVVTGGVKPTGGWQIDVLKVTVDGKNCVVSWQLNPPKGVATQAFTHPAVVALVDRCDGEVKFVLAMEKSKAQPPPPAKVDPSQSPANPAPGGDSKKLEGAPLSGRLRPGTFVC